MVLTLNQLVKTVKTIALNHTGVNSFYFGPRPDFDRPFDVEKVDGTVSSEIVYPLCGLSLIRNTKIAKSKNTVFVIWVCDLVHEGDSNKNEVLSDTDLTIEEIHDALKEYMEFTQTATKGSVLDTFSWEEFTERLDDGVSGHAGEITITQKYTRDKCLIPVRATIDYTNPNAVQIIDQDGNVLETVAPGGSYQVIVLQRIKDTINGNTTTIIDNIN